MEWFGFVLVGVLGLGLDLDWWVPGHLKLVMEKSENWIHVRFRHRTDSHTAHIETYWI